MRPEPGTDATDTAQRPAPAATAIVARAEEARSTALAPPALRMLDLQELAKARALFAEFVSQQLKVDVHYGVIPGTGKKPVLLKPGAEEVLRLYMCSAAYEETVVAEDFATNLYVYRVRCRAIDGAGIERAQGMGVCSSYESRYRWRDSKRRCPACKAEAIIKGREEYGGGWVCHKKQGGCGAKFDDADAAITTQTVGRVENVDLADAQNTVLKMACKRALVAAAINLGCCSEKFTQDLEDAPKAHAPVAPGDVATPSAQPPPETPPASNGGARRMTSRYGGVCACGVAVMRGMQIDYADKKVVGCEACGFTGVAKDAQTPRDPGADDDDVPADYGARAPVPPAATALPLADIATERKAAIAEMDGAGLDKPQRKTLAENAVGPAAATPAQLGAAAWRAIADAARALARPPVARNVTVTGPDGKEIPPEPPARARATRVADLCAMHKRLGLGDERATIAKALAMPIEKIAESMTFDGLGPKQLDAVAALLHDAEAAS